MDQVVVYLEPTQHLVQIHILLVAQLPELGVMMDLLVQVAIMIGPVVVAAVLVLRVVMLDL